MQKPLNKSIPFFSWKWSWMVLDVHWDILNHREILEGLTNERTRSNAILDNMQMFVRHCVSFVSLNPFSSLMRQVLLSFLLNQTGLRVWLPRFFAHLALLFTNCMTLGKLLTIVCLSFILLLENNSTYHHSNMGDQDNWFKVFSK
jgi:hypothetical protein